MVLTNQVPSPQAVRQAKTLFSLMSGLVPIFQPFRAGCCCNPNRESMPISAPHLPDSVHPIRPSGARRMNLHMLTMLDRADSFAGMPRGTAKPLRFLAGFQEAEPYLGLPVHAFKLVSLVKQTQSQDWEEGSRPITWPSARRQAEFLGLSPSRVKTLNRALFEAGIFVIRDNEQGKRYGRRGLEGKIIEAYGGKPNSPVTGRQTAGMTRQEPLSQMEVCERLPSSQQNLGISHSRPSFKTPQKAAGLRRRGRREVWR